jgi:hypothetical protein
MLAVFHGCVSYNNSNGKDASSGQYGGRRFAPKA